MNLSQCTNNLEMARVFQFDQTGRGIFGNGAVESVGAQAKWLGAGKVVVLTDKGIEEAGLVDRVLESLKVAGLGASVYDGIPAEPSMETIRAATAFVKMGRYDVVIGVGGGSCMDTAKMAAVMQNNPGEPQDYVCSEEDSLQKGSPMIMIPTTAGTGSEFSDYSVVIEEGHDGWALKNWWWGKALFADVAIVDPTMTLTCPPAQTAGSGMDALSHVVEALMSRLAMPLSDALALQAVALISSNLRRAYHRGEDLEARWAVSLAAAFGGMTIAFPWVNGPAIMGHMTAEALGPRYGIPHGLACALVLPYAMDFNLPGCMDKLALVASAMGVDVRELSLREAACEAVRAVAELMKDCGMCTSLEEHGVVPREDLPGFAEYLVNERQYLYDMQATNPRKLTTANVTRFLEAMWEGRLGQ